MVTMPNQQNCVLWSNFTNSSCSHQPYRTSVSGRSGGDSDKSFHMALPPLARSDRATQNIWTQDCCSARKEDSVTFLAWGGGKVAPFLGSQRTRTILIDRWRKANDCNRCRTSYIMIVPTWIVPHSIVSEIRSGQKKKKRVTNFYNSQSSKWSIFELWQ